MPPDMRKALQDAAEKYLETLPPEEREKLASESIELKGFGLEGKVIGKRIVSENFTILIIAVMLTGFGVWHHIMSAEMLAKVLDATAENTYVLSLSQEQRERLQISMPESLRKKMRNREQ